MQTLLTISALCAWLVALPLQGGSSVGFRVVQIPDGPKTAVWYPATESAAPHAHPLIVFSHGWGGCGTQSRFLVEELARAGYIVVAPDHRDAACSVEGRRLPRIHIPESPFTAPGRWRETTYDDRRVDLQKALDWILASPDFRGSIDPARIGAMGHSLGGYSVLSLAGAWESWKDPRITAVLALSPYVKPLLRHERLQNIHVPVMYQDAQFDWGITPSLRGTSGAFAQTPAPKYYVELRGGNHFSWTNTACFGRGQGEDCIRKSANARLIVDYSVAFFDRYLKQRSEALSRLDGAGLRTYKHVD